MGRAQMEESGRGLGGGGEGDDVKSTHDSSKALAQAGQSGQHGLHNLFDLRAAEMFVRGFILQEADCCY